MVEAITKITNFFKEMANFWDYVANISHWAATIGCVVLLILYTATGDRVFIQKIGLVIVIYILIRGVGLAL